MVTLADVQRALTLPSSAFDVVAAQDKMAPHPRPRLRPPKLPGQAKQGAVLLLLFAQGSAVNLVFVRRPLRMNNHPGQIAFPGGKQDEGERLETTAVRETYEEIGIPAHQFELLGSLHPVYIPPSDFEVHPFVAWHTAVPQFRPSPAEVDEVLTIPLTHLRQPTNQHREIRHIQGTPLTIPYFQIGQNGQDKIWGGTAAILSEFLERLRLVS